MRMLIACSVLCFTLADIAYATEAPVYVDAYIWIDIENIPTSVDPEDEPTWCDIHSLGFPTEIQYWYNDIVGQPTPYSADGVIYLTFDRAESIVVGNQVVAYKYWYEGDEMIDFSQNSGFEWEPVTLLPMGYIWDGESSGSPWYDVSQKELLDYGQPLHTITFFTMTAPYGFMFVEE